MKWFFVLVFLCFPVASFAACGGDCITPPSCADLGYSREILCPESYVLCPLDSSYKWCKQYTCADGRYETEPKNVLDGYKCNQVMYHGLSCYNCQFGSCPDSYYNSETCWNGLMHEYVGNPDNCSSLGYTDYIGECSSYLVCPADENRIKCIQ